MLSENNSAIGYMPKESEDMRILQNRADLIAREITDQHQHTETDSYIQFYLGENELYGIDYKYTKEVINSTHLTQLPCSPHFVAGIINRRGALLTVLDLKKLLFRQSADYQNKNSIIIVSDNQITVGILADQIVGNQYYDLKLLDASLPSENIIKPEFIVGLHQGKVAMLNISAIITESQLQLSKGTVYEHNK